MVLIVLRSVVDFLCCLSLIFSKVQVIEFQTKLDRKMGFKVKVFRSVEFQGICQNSQFKKECKNDRWIVAER